jgi:hypothetical protein
MKTQHTQGPWTTDTSGEGKPFSIITSVHDEHGLDDDVCEVYGGNTDCEKIREANARLIAAAPQMLDALLRLTHPMADDEDVEFALQTIEKARKENK